MTTVVGNGSPAFGGDGGAATGASIDYPENIAIDRAGNLYVADALNYRVRMVNRAGFISTIAGTGTFGYSGDSGAATAARFTNPHGICIDSLGAIYISDINNNVIRKINTSGIITTVAGNGTAGFSGDGGQATNAKFNQPMSVAVDATGNLYIADEINNRIRKVDRTGIVSTIAGSGSAGFSGDGGAATDAKIQAPYSVALDRYGNIVFADAGNARIRSINSSGVIRTIAGTTSAGFSGDGGAATNAQLWWPYSLFIDGANNLFVGDGVSNRLRKVDTAGTITTLAGNGSAIFGGDGGPATAAQLTSPLGIAMDARGNIYISDRENNRIRMIKVGYPYVANISGTSIMCTGATTTLTDSTPGGTWSSDYPGIAAINSSGVVTGVSGGIDTIRYTVTNSCGVNSVSHPLTVRTALIGGFITGVPEMCAGDSSRFVDSVVGGTWSTTDASVATVSATGMVRAVGAGNADVIYFVSGPCGSAGTSYGLTVDRLPDAGTITGPTDVCIGNHISLSNGVSGGTWSSTALHSTLATGVVTGHSRGVDTIYYLVNGPRCHNVTDRIVNIDSLPAVGPISGPSFVCSGATAVFTDAASGGSWGSSTGRLTVGSGIATGHAPGLDTIHYTLTNLCGAATVVTPVQVDTSVVPTVAILKPADTDCILSPMTLTAQFTHGGTSPAIKWLKNGAIVGTGDTLTYLPAFGDEIQCVLVSSAHCPVPATVSVDTIVHAHGAVTPFVTIHITHDTTAYPGEIIAFDAEETFGGSDPQYQWFLNGVAVPGATNNAWSYTIYYEETVYCSVTSNLPCITTNTDTSNAVTIHPYRLSAAALQDNLEIGLYPNPNNGSFDLRGNATAPSIKYEMLNAIGQSVQTGTVEVHNGKVDSRLQLMDQFAAGQYYLKLTSEAGIRHFQFVVVR